MDQNDFHKNASRKRLNTEAENLREKITRETSKIIKLKIGQDTAYWDLKEKLRQVEENHEKLSRNMVEVQMQHEAISGQYQEELRLRPDTLNKVGSTREICDVLEEYSDRLKATLVRCQADQAALGEAYQRCGRRVAELHDHRLTEADRSRGLIAGLEEKVKLMTEHQCQLLQLFKAEKQQMHADSCDLRAQLAAAQTRKEELVTSNNELEMKLDQCKRDVEKKDQINANLQAEMKQLMEKLNKQAIETENVLALQDKQIKTFEEEIQSLKKIIDSQNQQTESITEQKFHLQEKLAMLEKENHDLQKSFNELEAKFEESQRVKQCLQNSVITLNGEKQSLLEKIQEFQQVFNGLQSDLKNLEAIHIKLENEKSNVVIELNKSVEECKNRDVEIKELVSHKEELMTKLLGLEETIQILRDTSEGKSKELNALIEAKDAELDSKACTITKLMSEVKKLENELHKYKNELMKERDAATDKEKIMNKTIVQLEVAVREKDDELSKQMAIILEIRSEKERLQEKVQSNQNMMDNIQKELTRPSLKLPDNTEPPVTRTEPEQDDNAVINIFSPQTQQPQMQQPQTQQPQPREPDESVYTMFSDNSSMDGNVIDPAEVNRRFFALARGERLSPAPLSALRRRTNARSHRAKYSKQNILSHDKKDSKNQGRVSLAQQQLVPCDNIKSNTFS